MIQKGTIYVLNTVIMKGSVTYTSPAKGWKLAAIVPEHVSMQQVVTAWTSAVRLTADGIDRPNWEKAIQRLNEYHPSWMILRSDVGSVSVDLGHEQDDQPDRP